MDLYKDIMIGVLTKYKVKISFENLKTENLKTENTNEIVEMICYKQSKG